jgi:hypothetical protein
MRCAGCPKPNRSLSSAVRHLLRLELHALLHVLGFAVLVLPHEFVIPFSLAPFPLTLSFACLSCLLGVPLLRLVVNTELNPMQCAQR